MKIAFLNLYSGTNNRGAESFAHKLADKLAKNYQVDFFRGKDFGAPIIQPEHKRTLLKLFFLDKASLSVLWFTLKIFKDLKDYDWIIPMNGFWQVLLCKFLRSKILITGHSGPGWDERWNLYLKPDVFVATTEPTAKWAKKTCPWAKIVTIPYGIDPIKTKPIKLDLEEPIILCPAAAVQYKRVELAIKAVAKMKKGSLLHLGDGPLIAELKTLGEKLLGKRFLSLIVKHEDVGGYYAASDIVTLPSTSQENSPMVFLEAMAAGKYTVTTAAPRSKWILGEAGVYVDPTNETEYAQALEITINKKDKTVIEDQLKKYSWKIVLNQYKLIFDKD